MNTTDETISPAGAGESPRRLSRSSSDKVLTGLAGGLGRYLGVDPVVFRIAFVVLSFVGGTGILLYLAGWLLIPDDTGASEADRLLNPRNRKLALWVLAIVGVGLFLDGFDDHFGGFPFGLALVALGFAVLWSRRDGSRDGGGGGTTTTPPSMPPPAGTEPNPHVSLAKATEEVAPHAPPPPAASGAPKAPKPPKLPKPRSVLVPATLSILAILAGVMALVGVSVDTGIAVALLITGVALVIGAWRGRARGLIPVAILLSLGLAAASVVDVPLRGGAGDRSYRPATVADVRSPYRLGAGEMTLDLSAVDLAPSSSRTIVATVGLGALMVIVPRTAEVLVIGHAGLGELRLFGLHSEGMDVDRRVTSPGLEGGGRLIIRAGVGVGQVEVRRALS
ncbi:MAG: PspC domain-containing protein [Acidimicrobiales bacterium]